MSYFSFDAGTVEPSVMVNPAVVLPGRGCGAFASVCSPGMEIDLAGLLGNPELFCRVFLGEHCRSLFNGMHRFSFEEYRAQMETGLPGRRGRRLAIAAPRGAAKSTIHTMLFPIMDILSGRERHQVIISGTMQQAKNRLTTIAHELRNNGAIRDGFFGGRMPRFKCNSKRVEIGNCRIEAFSAGSEMRGISHGEYRPTRIILDDVEQSSRISQAYQRRDLLRWYDEVVENLGDSYTHITIVGTILHTDSLLSTLLNRPGYRSELYKSIIAWDERPDLWRVWRRLFMDFGDRDSVGTAGAFLAENREAMLAGTEVFWPSKEPYEKLQEKLLIMGRSAFFKEKQNSPLKDGEQIFDTGLWRRFFLEDGHIRVLALEQEEAMVVVGESGRAGVGDGAIGDDRSDRANGSGRANRATRSDKTSGAETAGKTSRTDSKLRIDGHKYFGFLDPALGKVSSRDGDYAAIVTIGKAPDNTLYVMDVWMEKASPMKQVEQVFALHKQYRYDRFGFESNGFQEILGKLIRDRQEQLRRGGRYWHLPVEKISNQHNKHSRIALLEPHILAGSILFHQDLKQEFFVQADEYDGRRCNHDDGLDALASCVEMIRGMEIKANGIRLVGRRVAARGF